MKLGVAFSIFVPCDLAALSFRNLRQRGFFAAIPPTAGAKNRFPQSRRGGGSAVIWYNSE
jgi:hypothetical protein